VVETLERAARFCTTPPATATNAYVTSVVQTAGEFRDGVVITIKTANAAFADTDVTATTTVSFTVVIRTARMNTSI
jgi:hypothetical protein